jgi:hypothetical protein
MATIFISYRRADGGWARSLFQKLEKEFDVFFDADKIEYGADFPDEILEELADARIVLVVVGKEWMAQAKERLAKPGDWVRRELQEALGKLTQIRVVPVFFDEVSSIPAEILPPDIEALARRNAIMVRNDSFERDAGDLIAKIHDWLAREGTDTAEREPAIDVLPHLCDRIDQQEDLHELLAEGGLPTKTPAVIVHGHKWEEHAGFLERMVHNNGLLHLLAPTGAEATPAEGGDTHPLGMKVFPALEWSPERARGGDYAKVLKRALKRAIWSSLTPSDAELLAYFQSLRQPTVMVLQMTWNEYKLCGPTLVDGFASAWLALFQTPEGARIDPPQPVLFWINFTYEELEPALDADSLLSAESSQRARALHRLKPIEQRHVDDWLTKKEVKPHLDAAGADRIKALPDDKERALGEGRMHMARFVEGVRPLLRARR